MKYSTMLFGSLFAVVVGYFCTGLGAETPVLLEGSREVSLEVEALPAAEKPVAPDFKEPEKKADTKVAVQGDIDEGSGIATRSKVVVPVIERHDPTVVPTSTTPGVETGDPGEPETFNRTNFSKFSVKKNLEELQPGPSGPSGSTDPSGNP